MRILKVLNHQCGWLNCIFKGTVRQASSKRGGKHKNVKLAKIKSLEADIFKNEVLFGRSVCNIALKVSRRPMFKLHLLKAWESIEPDDPRILESISLAKARGIPFSYLCRNRLDALSLDRPHQGICLEVGELPYYMMDQTNCKNMLGATSDNKIPQFWVLLCGILDPMNVGAILRSCLYFGVDKVAVTGDCAPLTPIVSKASSGAAEILRINKIYRASEVLKLMLTEGWEVIGTVAHSNNQENTARTVYDISDVKTKKSSIILFGSEGSGLPGDLLKLCTKLVTIRPPHNTSDPRFEPELRGLVDSLNVSSAAAIILHGLQKKTST